MFNKGDIVKVSSSNTAAERLANGLPQVGTIIRITRGMTYRGPIPLVKWETLDGEIGGECSGLRFDAVDFSSLKYPIKFMAYAGPITFTDSKLGIWQATPEFRAQSKPTSLSIQHFFNHAKLVSMGEPEVAADQFSPETSGRTYVAQPNVTPKVQTVRRKLTVEDIEVGQAFIVHGVPDVVYVKISNSHVFNQAMLQMHTVDAKRFEGHLNLVAYQVVVLNGK